MLFRRCYRHRHRRRRRRRRCRRRRRRHPPCRRPRGRLLVVIGIIPRARADFPASVGRRALPAR